MRCICIAHDRCQVVTTYHAKEITMGKHEVAKGDIFCAGEVWVSPRGTLYKVMTVELRQAALRMGSDGSGRIILRPYDAVINWSISREHNHG
ncbi:MAG: hypothetical protein ACRDE7_05455 [Sphingobacterium sp.]